MTTGGVGPPGEPLVLGRPEARTTVEAVADRLTEGDVVATEVTLEPPRLPHAEDEVVPAGRGVGGGGGAHEPLDLGIGQRTTCVVGGVDRDGGGIGRVIRARALGAGGDLELGGAELLDLERMAAIARVRGIGADELQFDVGLAEIGGIRDVDREIEATERVELDGAAVDVVALGVIGPEVDLDGVGDRLEAGGAREVDAAHPTREPGRLPRLVDTAVVEDIPARLRAVGLGSPSVVPARRQHADDTIELGDQALNRAATKRVPGQPVGVGGDDGVGAEHGDRDITEGPAGEEIGGPDQQLVGVDDGVDRQGGLLDERVAGAVLPVVVAVRCELPCRFEANHDRAVGFGEGVGEVDRRLGDRVVVAVDVDLTIEHERPVGIGGLGVGVGGVEEAQVLRVLIGRDGPRRDPHAVVVDRRDAHRRIGGRRVDRDELAIEPPQVRPRRTDVELRRIVLAERLPEGVGQLTREGHLVGGAPGGCSGDLQRVAVQVDPLAGDRRIDGDHRRGEAGGVDGVVELDDEGGEWGTATAVAARGVGHLEPAEGVGAKQLGVRGDQRALRRGRSGVEGHLDGAVDRKRIGGPERDHATLEARGHGAGRVVVGFDLRRRRLANWALVAPCGEGEMIEHGRRRDDLIEGRDEDRRQWKAVGFADEGLYDRWRRGEGERHRFGQLATGDRGGAGGDLHPVLGGRRQPIGEPGLDLEAQRPRTDPPPTAFDGRRDHGGNGFGGELVERRQGHHRLAEGDAQEWSDAHVALGLEPEDLEGSTGRCGRTAWVGRRWERPLDRVAHQRWPQGFGWPVELLSVGLGHLPGGEPTEHLGHLVVGQRCALDHRRARGFPCESRSFAQPQREELRGRTRGAEGRGRTGGLARRRGRSIVSPSVVASRTGGRGERDAHTERHHPPNHP